MKSLVLILVGIISIQSFAQKEKLGDEFLPIHIEGKEAFLSTKTGEYVYRKHEETDVSMLETTDTGVIYTDIKLHAVVKGDNISKIAKKHGLSQAQLMKDNKLASNKLSIGQKLKIIKKLVVDSSSPVISQDESKIIARLNPGQTPTGLDAVPPPPVRSSIPSTEKTQPEENQVQETVEDVEVEEEQATEEDEEVEESLEVEEVEETLEVEKIQETKEIEDVEEVEEENNDTNYYTVVKGDNLYEIAKKHNTTVENLMKVNNLKSNNLSIGQKLKLK